LQEICAGRGAALISDEVFFDYLDPGEVSEAARSGDPIVSAVPAQVPGLAGQAGGALTFALGGRSKACGLPQMKLGWIVADGPGKAVSEALERLDLIADTYLSVGTPVMRAAGRLIEIGAAIRSAIGRRLAANLEALRGRLRPGSACRLLRREGGWYVGLPVPAVATGGGRGVCLLSVAYGGGH